MRRKAEFIKRAVEQLGVALSPSSRLGQEINFYLDPKGHLPQIVEPDHPLFQVGVECHRDINQVAFALKQLLPIVSAEAMKKKVRLLVADKVLPQDNPEESPGRDAQCELFVAALSARADLKPVFDERPDLHCQFNGKKHGVAIKRIKTPPERFARRLEERVSEAAKQILGSGIPGTIVIDISQSLNPTNWWVPIEFTDAQLDAGWDTQVSLAIGPLREPLLESTRGRNVRGIIFIDHVLRCLPSKEWRMELRGSSINCSPFNQGRRREFDGFDAKFGHALCNPGEFSDET